MNPRPTSARAGFSLVLSLIILTLLAIMVAGFLSSTAMDRTTAHAFSDKANAEMAAGTAVNQAMSTLREYIAQYPDSATTWEKLVPRGGGPGVEGTMLYYNDLPPPNGIDNPSTSTTTTPAKYSRYILPLMSRGVDGNGIPLGAVPVTKNDNPLNTVTPKDKTYALGTDPWQEAFSGSGTSAIVPNCVDLNRPQFNGDTAGWIGAAPEGRRPFYAKWIEVKDNSVPTPKTIGRYAFWMEDESFKVNLNLLGASPRGNEASENGRLKTTDFTKTPLPPQIAALTPIQGLLRSAGAPAGIDPDTVATSVSSLRNGFFGARLPGFRSFNQIKITSAANGDYLIADETKFLATAFSGGLNVSRHGSQRLNLNGLGFDNPNVTPADITNQLVRLVETIRYHAPKFGQRFYRLQYKITDPLSLSDSKTIQELARRNAEQVSTVYPTSTARISTSHHDTYLYKLAANIRDYIDPDFQPTLVVLDPASPIAKPTGMSVPRDKSNLDMFAVQSTNPCWAMGKEGAPQIQEVVVRFRSEATGGTSYRLRVDYYVEFWNMTNHDVNVDTELGPNPFIKISNPVRWYAHKSLPTPAGYGDPLLGMPSPTDPRDLILNLAGLHITLPAGACTVITSAPADPNNPTEFAMIAPFIGTNGGGSTDSTGGIRSANPPCLWRVPPANQVGSREFTGSLPPPPPKVTYNGFWPMPRETGGSATPNQEDYETEVVFGNDLGILDAVPYAVSMGGGGNITYLNPTIASGNPRARDDTYGGTLHGNSHASSPTGPTPSQLGDPRANNEQLKIIRYTGGGDPDQTRYFNPYSNDTYRFSLGWPNSRFVAPHLNSNPYVSGSTAPYGYPWPDFYKVWQWTYKDKSGQYESNDVPNPNADTAPAVVRSANLSSIGQLGDVYDPARVLNVNASATLGIEYSRGGGRTLKIGQPDDLVDMLSPADKAPSRAWAAWRLADFLGTSSEIQLPGQININGLRRDNGAAFRAACLGMKIKPVSCSVSLSAPAAGPYDKDLSSVEKASNGLQVLIDQAVHRIRNNDPAGDDPEGEAYDSKIPYFGPFMERGELSELPIFNSATNNMVSGVNMSDTFDHGREELYSRLAEMITTRGNIFSVYAVGQSIVEGVDAAKTKRVTATHQVKVTFALVPRKADGTAFQVTAETFDPKNVNPLDSKSLAFRFAKPDHYDIQILQVSNP